MIKLKRVGEKVVRGANASLTTTLFPTLNNTILTLQKPITANNLLDKFPSSNLISNANTNITFKNL